MVEDYVLRCVKGIYKNKFIYLNLSEDGEIIGSEASREVTLQIENAGLSQKHCKI